MSQPLTCPNCDTVVPPNNMNLRRMVAVCPTCNTVFQFEGGAHGPVARDPSMATGGPPRKHKPRQALTKPEVVTPSKHIRIFDDTVTGGIEIHRKAGHGGQIIFMTFFTLFWDGFMVVWFGIAFANEAYEMAAFGSLHGLIGVGLTYYLLMAYLNKTVIAVSPDKLVVKTVPIFRHPPREYDAGAVAQVFVQRNSSNTESFNVCIEDTYGHAHLLANGFSDYQDALFVEREVERYLEIDDAPVPGEHRRAGNN